MVNRVFVRLASIYGNLWTSQFRTNDMLNAAKAEWAITLAQFSPSDLGRALQVCKKHFMGPPTLPKFLDLAKQCRPVTYYRGLPKPKSNPGIVQSNIREMRKSVSR